ncbi:MAG: RNA polymerase factor sigma-54 [Gemmatimonadetes bacterium]|nr:RNA polymerase factor sigma-54 [Gemmatimonadota bacterium]
MRAGLSQSVRLGQEMKINPRLYQAMDMLYMPLLDLQQHLKQELLVNPFLELSDDDDPDASDASEADADNGADDADAQTAADDGGDVTDLAAGAEGDGAEDSQPDSDADAEPDLAEALASPEEATTRDSGEFEKWDEILTDGFEPEGGVREEREEREYVEPVSVAVRDLAEHLREQLQLLDLSPRQRLLAEEFVGNIGDDGYLTATLEEIREGINQVMADAAERAGRDEDETPLFSPVEVELMLGIIQGLEPAGVGARDLRECLLLQLRGDRDGDRDRESLAVRLVRDHFAELVAHKWGELAKATAETPQAVQKAADRVAQLNPKPGRAVTGAADQYVVPDLVVEKIEGEYLVFANDGPLPRLRLSRTYQDLARDRKRFDAEHKEFIANKLSAAQWLIQAIEQRRQTMLKVMHFIVNRQREFFDKGIQHLRPLTLREVADAIGMHESTVSRVTNEKFVQTPRGVLSLKFFFSSGLATVDGEDVSARKIKDTIEKLVKAEDVRNPLTDQAIVAVLERDGVQIARRTVAKYRDQLGVLPARMRKRV